MKKIAKDIEELGQISDRLGKLLARREAQGEFDVNATAILELVRSLFRVTLILQETLDGKGK